MTPIPSPQGHPDPHEVTAYLSGTADPAARARIEAHIADCADCAEELVAVRRLHRGPPAVSRRFAVAGAQRTPEARLHFYELLGGWPGGLLAQRLIRHKNRKVAYQVKFWLIVAVHLGLLGYWLLHGAG